MNDIDKAIQGATVIKSVDISGTFGPTGRPFVLQVPVDMDEAEALSLAGALAAMPSRLRQARGPQIVVPKPVLVRQ